MPERSKILKNYRVTMERDSEGMIWLRVFLASMPAGPAVLMVTFTETFE